MSYQEIAVALRIPISDVKSHLFRARKALARSLPRWGMRHPAFHLAEEELFALLER